MEAISREGAARNRYKCCDGSANYSGQEILVPGNQAVFTQQRSTSATLQAWAMQPPAIVRLARVENFADRADARFVQMLRENVPGNCARCALSSG